MKSQIQMSNPLFRHCEEHSDEAICSRDCFSRYKNRDRNDRTLSFDIGALTFIGYWIPAYAGRLDIGYFNYGNTTK